MSKRARNDPLHFENWKAAKTGLGDAIRQRYPLAQTTVVDAIIPLLETSKEEDGWENFVATIERDDDRLREANETHVEKLHSLVLRKSKTPGFLMHRDTQAEYKKREIENAPDDEIVLIPRGDLSTTLLIVTGESGSGKTFSLTHSHFRQPEEFGVYFTMQDLLNHEWKETHASVSERNNEARRVLTETINALFQSTNALEHVERAEKELKFLVVIDEVGQFPAFTHALCAVYKDIIEMKWYKKHSFLFVAAGTGANSGSSSVGSLPSTYTLFVVRPNSGLWEKYLAKIQRNNPSQKNIVKRLRKDATAKDLGSNPRLATLMYRWLLEVENNRFGIVWKTLGSNVSSVAFNNFLQTFFVVIAAQYKMKNGMQNENAKSVRFLYESAVRAVLFPQAVDEDEDKSRHLLVTKYGLLIDHASWQFSSPSSSSASSVQSVTYKTSKQESLVGPAKRYSISQAQMQLFYMMYGLEATPIHSYDFEVTTARYCEMLLLACRTKTQGDFLSKLIPEMKASDYPAKLDYDDVVVLQSSVKIEPANTKKLLANSPLVKEIEKYLKQRCALVIINGPMAAYGDVIVLVGGAVPLHGEFQSKFYLETTHLSQETLEVENYKMGGNSQDGQISYVAQKLVDKDDVPFRFLTNGALTSHLNAHETNCSDCVGTKFFQAWSAQGFPKNPEFVWDFWAADFAEIFSDTWRVNRKKIAEHLKSDHSDSCTSCGHASSILEREKQKRASSGLTRRLGKLIGLAQNSEPLRFLISTKLVLDCPQGLRYLHATSESLYPVPLHDRSQPNELLSALSSCPLERR